MRRLLAQGQRVAEYEDATRGVIVVAIAALDEEVCLVPAQDVVSDPCKHGSAVPFASDPHPQVGKRQLKRDAALDGAHKRRQVENRSL
jgi:hypothetical protein